MRTEIFIQTPNTPPPVLCGPVAIIPVKKGFFALVDVEDAELASRYTWSLEIRESGQQYAYCRVKRATKGTSKIYLHRLILGFPDGMTDHRNGLGLDCRRSNLRVATNAENQRNTGPQTGKRYSRYKGVTYSKAKGKWQAQIRIDGGRKFLGYFPSEEEAAKAYNRAAVRYHKEFACLNAVETNKQQEGNHGTSN